MSTYKVNVGSMIFSVDADNYEINSNGVLSFYKTEFDAIGGWIPKYVRSFRPTEYTQWYGVELVEDKTDSAK